MRRYCNIFFLLVIAFQVSSQISDKKKLAIEVIKTAKDYDNLREVLYIIKEYPDIYNRIPLISPIKEKYRVSSSFGNRIDPIEKRVSFHNGIDLVADYAAIIYATANGKITFASVLSGYGKTVIIDHENGFMSYYGHMTEIYAKVDQQVSRGDPIGFLGNTGRSTGNHLHYEIRKDNRSINPDNFMNYD